jgi:hypothetical protein
MPEATKSTNSTKAEYRSIIGDLSFSVSINIKKSDVGATTAQKMILDDITPGHFKPIHSNRYLSNIHEYIFHFTKQGSNVKLNKLANGVLVCFIK